VQRCRSWLRDRGLLEELEPGSTPRYRSRLLRALLGSAGNRASVHRLTAPGEVLETTVDLVGDETGAPSFGPCIARSENARARGTRSPLRGGDANTTPWLLRRPARTRAERLAACERLRAESPTLRRVSARRLRHVLRPWLLAGWTVRGVQHALDHRPDGAPWRIPFRPDELRNPSGWVVHRMRAWTDADGAPLPDPYAVTEPRGRHQSRSEDDHGTPTILVAAVERRRPPTASFRAAREALRLRPVPACQGHRGVPDIGHRGD
jgi:hypothetical protein